MSRERHERLQELFLAAADLSPDEQSTFLDQACGGDAELRREVAELLAADSQPSESRPASSSPVTGDGSSVPLGSPQLFQGTGTYRVVREIGRGGMGVVYLAERADGTFDRRVAVKVLQRRTFDDGEIEQRFRTERRILAALDHPHIARLLDGGTLPDGSPFLVMEYVEGEPIDRFADRRRLTVEARLELFLAVCQAVQAAHQSLVVHRDLKPGNVLVTADGTPKLLDFGIAKLLDPHAADWTLAETRLGSQPLTPRYASPEQLRGEPITTATDVYSLAVVLYELLTGASPYRPRSSGVHHWVEAVCEQPPRAPSLAVGESSDADSRSESDRHGLERRLAGDLDHIVLKALRKEPRERYATAADLAADIVRHLDGQPIQARRPTLVYRAGKYVRRHRWGVAAVLTLALLAGAFTVGLVHQLRRTEVERDKARQVTELLVEVFGTANPGTAEDREVTAREVLDRGLERIQAGLDDQPEIKAALFDALGRVYNNLGRLDEAARVFEQALELRRPRQKEAPLDYADSLDRYAGVLLARAELDEAEATYREALAVTLAEVAEDDPRAIARLEGLKQVLATAGRHGEAEELARRIVELTLRRYDLSSVESVVASESVATELLNVTATLGSLAIEQRRLGRYDDAEHTLSQALAIDRRVLGDDHFRVAFDLNNLANIRSNREDYASALEARDQAVAVAEAALGPDHPSVGSLRLNRGLDLRGLDRHQEALEDVTRAREVLTAALGPGHPATATANSYLALVYTSLGRLDEALALQQDSLERRVAVLGEDHEDVAQSLSGLAETLLVLGRYEESIDRYRRALAIYERTLGPEHPETLECRSRLAEPLLAVGRMEEARTVLGAAVAALEARGDLPRQLARARQRLASAGVAGK